MMGSVPETTRRQPGGRARDWIPMGLTLCVWVCTLPIVALLIAPWLGVRAAVVTALGLLAVLTVVCWALCSARTP